MFNASTNVPVRKFDIFGCIEPPYRALSPHSFCRSLLAVGPAFLGGKGPAVYLWVFSCTDLHKEENRIRNWVNVVVVLGSSLPLERSELRKGRSAGKRDAADQKNGLGTVGLPIDEAVDVFAEGLFNAVSPTSGYLR